MRGLMILVMLVLVGCQTAAQQGPAIEQAPSNYRELVAARVCTDFFDPYSIRDAMISAPIPGQSFLGPVSTVCVRANAKNRMGAYTGATPTSFVFRSGQLTVTDSDYAGISCAAAVYAPFPEIEMGYKPTAPAAAAQSKKGR